jgi:hypothetical protein
MRSNSGSGKGKNNLRDQTLRDNEGKGGTSHPGQDFTEGSAFDIGGNAKVRGENTSPSDRKRGETASTDRAAPVDVAGS